MDRRKKDTGRGREIDSERVEKRERECMCVLKRRGLSVV